MRNNHKDQAATWIYTVSMVLETIYILFRYGGLDITNPRWLFYPAALGAIAALVTLDLWLKQERTGFLESLAIFLIAVALIPTIALIPWFMTSVPTGVELTKLEIIGEGFVTYGAFSCTLVNAFLIYQRDFKKMARQQVE